MILENLSIHKPCFGSASIRVVRGRVAGPWNDNETLPFAETPKKVLPAGIVRLLVHSSSSTEEDLEIKKRYCLFNVLGDGDCGAHVLSIIYRVLAAHPFYSPLPQRTLSPTEVRELLCDMVGTEFPNIDKSLYRDKMFDTGQVRYLEAPELALWCERFKLNSGFFGFTPGARNRQDYVLNIHRVDPSYAWVFFAVTYRANHYEIMAQEKAGEFCLTFSPAEAEEILSLVGPSSMFESPPSSFFENFEFICDEFVWNKKRRKK